MRSFRVTLMTTLLLTGCATPTPVQRAAQDQDITRDILWEFHQDPTNRFEDVKVTTIDGIVTLNGRVGDAKAYQEAMKIAVTHSRRGQVTSQLQIRKR